MTTMRMLSLVLLTGFVLVSLATAAEPPLVPATLAITKHSPLEREMKFTGTISGATEISASIDGKVVEAKYLQVYTKKKTWTVRLQSLDKGDHTLTVSTVGAAGPVSVCFKFTIPR